MTLPSSGAIRFSDLQTEYGGTNPISLSEYRASFKYTNIYISLSNNSGTWSLGGPSPLIGDVNDVINRGMIVQLLVIPQSGYPIYLSTTDTPGATDLLTTGVTNNGATADNDVIVWDTSTYTTPNIATGDGLPFYRVYIKSTVASGLTARALYLVERPATELVRYLGRNSTITWPSSLQGGSGSVLTNSGAFLSSVQANKTLLKNGQSIQMKTDCFSLGDVNSGGSYLFTYIAVAPVTGNHPNWSYGTTVQMAWSSQFGTGSPSYIGAGVGGLADTAANVASLTASTCSSARVADTNPITGMTLSATVSSTTVTWTLTNNTGSQYYLNNYLFNDGTTGPLHVWSGASTTQTANQSSRNATWGSSSANRVNQQYGVPLYMALTLNFSGINYFYFYNAPDAVDRTQLITGIKAAIAATGSAGRLGLTVSDITGGISIDSSFGDFTAVNVQYFNQHVATYSTSSAPGASNISATLTDGTLPSTPAAYSQSARGFNSLVPSVKEDFKLSHFYNGVII